MIPSANNALRLLLGAALLTLGRRLYWLFVAAVGFLLGLRAASALLQQAPDWLLLLIAAVVGLLGAGLAVVLQRFGIALAGLMAGALAANSLLASLDAGSAAWAWVVYLICGVLGAVLLSLLFDWTLIVLSSIVGAVVITETLAPAAPWDGALFFAALLVGIMLQSRAFRRPRASTFST